MGKNGQNPVIGIGTVAKPPKMKILSKKYKIWNVSVFLSSVIIFCSRNDGEIQFWESMHGLCQISSEIGNVGKNDILEVLSEVVLEAKCLGIGS